MADLAPEDITEEEKEKVEQLRAAVLEDQGLSAPPEGWKRHFYLQSPLLCFLRGRDGVVEDAKTMIVGAMKWFDDVNYWDQLRKYETEDDPAHKALIAEYSSEGVFGKDRRGAPVLYTRPGAQDTAGIIAATEMWLYVRSCIFGIETTREKVYNASVEAGVYFMGIITVVDCAGLTWSRAQSTIGFLMFITDSILKDHFPEYSSRNFVVNVPWYLHWGWKVCSNFLPARTVAKTAVYGSNFRSDLEELVDPSQIPPFLGGKSTEPWPYSMGGDVPRGDGQGGDSSVPGIAESKPTELYVSKLETVEVEVPAGKTCIWEWRVVSYDVDFRAEVDGQEVEELRRVDASEAWQAGKHYARPGGPAQVKVKLTFDNSHSYVRGKSVEYRIFQEDIPEMFEDAAAESAAP